MNILRLSVLSVAVLALAGCSSMSLESKRIDYKSGVTKTSSLEVPPDLTAPSAEDHYLIPEGSGSVASYSEFAKGNAVPRSSTVLPESRKVHLEHDGARHWLVVEDRAENLWPLIKAFFQENGLVIKVEDPQAGVIETDWAENRAKIPRSGLRSLLGKVVDGLYDSGEKDMYRVRLERGKDGKSTEVYLTQYGKEEVLSQDQSTSTWQSRPNDPELEATMLQMLMAKLGGAETQVKASAGETASALPPSAPKLQTLSDGSKGIVLSEPFDRSWRAVGLALERAGFAVEDKDRAGGVYFLRIQKEAQEKKGWLDKLAFWRSDEKAKPDRYQVTVREVSGGGSCEIGANDGTGASNEDTEWVVDALYKALGK